MDKSFFEILVQYGALGIFCAYLIWVNATASKETNKVLSEIKSIFEKQLAQSEMYNKTIDHERDRSEECYEKVVHVLGDLKIGQLDAISRIESIGNSVIAKLDQVVTYETKCAECKLKSKD